MQSNFQSETDLFTSRTILRGVIVGPDGYFRGSFCPVASSLTFVPPTSITRTCGVFTVRAAFIATPLPYEQSHLLLGRAMRILEGTGCAAKRILALQLR